MYLKIIGSILILSASSLIGFILSRDCANRLDELRNLQNMLHLFHNEVFYLSNVLKDSFNKIGRNNKSKTSVFFLETVNFLDSGDYKACEAWEKSVKDNIRKTSLNKEDEDILMNFGKLLGASDIEGQIKNIEITVNQLKFQEKKAEEYKMKNEKMYKSLGVLVGLAIVIVLI